MCAWVMSLSAYKCEKCMLNSSQVTQMWSENMRMADKASYVDYPLGDIFHYSFIFKNTQVSRSSSQLSDNYSMDKLTFAARGFPFSIIILELLNAKQKQQRHHIFLSISNFFPNLCWKSPLALSLACRTYHTIVFPYSLSRHRFPFPQAYTHPVCVCV